MSESITLFAFAAVLIAIASTFFMVEFLNLARVTLFGSKQRGAPFDPARDLPSLAGKVVLITGAAGDLGRQAAIELARYSSPRRIYVADLPLGDAAKKAVVDNIAREATKGSKGSDESHRQTEIKFLDLDLTSFQSVKRCVADFMAQEERLDILFLNAGIIRVAPGKTKEGYEIHFGLNYVGHALLSRLLLPTLMRTAQKPDADVRVIVVSSEGHAMAPEGGVQFDKVKTDCAALSYTARYGQSKLALIAYVRELAHHHPEIRTATIHPGRIITGMAKKLGEESLLVRLTIPITAPLICVPVTVGILNHLWAATSSKVVSGTYYEPVGVPGKESALAKDRQLSRKLWEWTENELKGSEDVL